MGLPHYRRHHPQSLAYLMMPQCSTGIQTSWDASAGVLTKLDIMDKGTDASAMMRNQIVPLRLGYIGMVNRSQMDINLNRSIRDAGAAEAAFFETHPEYNEVRMAIRLYNSTAIAGSRLPGYTPDLLIGKRVMINETGARQRQSSIARAACRAICLYSALALLAVF